MCRVQGRQGVRVRVRGRRADVDRGEVAGRETRLPDAVLGVVRGLQRDVNPLVQQDAGDGGVHGFDAQIITYPQGHGIEKLGDASAVDEDEWLNAGLDVSRGLVNPAEGRARSEGTPGLSWLIATAFEVYDDDARSAGVDAVLAGHDHAGRGRELIGGIRLRQLVVQGVEERRPERRFHGRIGIKDDDRTIGKAVSTGCRTRCDGGRLQRHCTQGSREDPGKRQG